jgi:hypothetical protein
MVAAGRWGRRGAGRGWWRRRVQDRERRVLRHGVLARRQRHSWAAAPGGDQRELAASWLAADPGPEPVPLHTTRGGQASPRSKVPSPAPARVGVRPAGRQAAGIFHHGEHGGEEKRCSRAFAWHGALGIVRGTTVADHRFSVTYPSGRARALRPGRGLPSLAGMTQKTASPSSRRALSRG